MSREDEIAAIMLADDSLMAILLGGVHKYSVTGQDGITRETTPTAFDDTTKYLQPCVLVKQRGLVPDGQVQDFNEQIDSGIQVVEVKFYQKRGSYAAIDLAMARVRTLFFGETLTDSFELYIANVIDRQHDDGALKGASLAEQHWVVHSVTGA